MPHAPASDSDSHAALRRSVYLLLIAIAAGNVAGRLFAVNSVDTIRLESHINLQTARNHTGGGEPVRRELERPFLSANDRSRWCTVRALVEHGTYAIDRIIVEPNWDTIDMVKHDGRGNPAPGPDEGHCYSSKPPLLATLMAGEYWLLHRVTGKTLGSHPHELGRILLFTWNVIPLVAYLVILAGIAERYGRTDFGRILVMAAGAVGTLVTSYAVVFTNHWPAAFAAMLSLDAVLRIVVDGERRWWWFLIGGTAAAFTAACELPALSWGVCVLTLLAWKSPRTTLLAAAPGIAVVVAAAIGTNYMAHGTMAPAYAQRHVAGGWYDYQYRRDNRVIDSYWKPTTPKSKIDLGEPSVIAYAFDVTVGHHGIFSLTPVWIVSLAGIGMVLRRRAEAGESRCAERRAIAAAILACTVACLVFYVTRPLGDRNYGGTATGFRWVIWFTPLWLYAMLPAADAMAGYRSRRLVAAGLLAISVLTASYPTWNPWTLPWLQVFMDYAEGPPGM